MIMMIVMQMLVMMVVATIILITIVINESHDYFELILKKHAFESTLTEKNKKNVRFEL